MEHMKERRLRDFFAGLFDSRRGDEPAPTKLREVPKLTERQVAVHSRMRTSGVFTVERAAKLYPKRDETK